MVQGYMEDILILLAESATYRPPLEEIMDKMAIEALTEHMVKNLKRILDKQVEMHVVCEDKKKHLLWTRGTIMKTVRLLFLWEHE
jgi:hypothetical protein